MTLKVERTAPDMLTMKQWVFYVVPYTMRVRLYSYTEFHRPSRRHGWKVSGLYDGNSPRKSTIPCPPVAEDVIAEMERSLVAQLDYSELATAAG